MEREREKVRMRANAAALERGSNATVKDEMNDEERLAAALSKVKRRRIPRMHLCSVSITWLPPHRNATYDSSGVMRYTGWQQEDERKQTLWAEEDGNVSRVDDVGASRGLATTSRWAAQTHQGLTNSRKRRAEHGMVRHRRRNNHSGGRAASQQSDVGGDGEDDDEWESIGGSESQSLSQSQSQGLNDEDDREDDDDGAQQRQLGPQTSEMMYPRDALMLARLLSVMSDCYAVNMDRGNINQREFHYNSKDLFPSQRSSDASLSKLAAILQVRRHELDVVGTPKGNIMGPLIYDIISKQDEAERQSRLAAARDGYAFINADGSDMTASGPALTSCDCSDGATITPYVDCIRGMRCNAGWILIVEKHTVWSKLAQSGFTYKHNCLLITDKGMPSIPTRQFLSLLHRNFPSLPILGLFDADPDGLNIYSVYKHGSVQSAMDVDSLPDMGWIGVSIRDMEQRGLIGRATLPLTARDKTRLTNMLASEVGQKDDIIRVELELLRSYGLKGEIESISHADNSNSSSGSDVLSSYIMDKLRQMVEEEERQMQQLQQQQQQEVRRQQHSQELVGQYVYKQEIQR